MSKQTTRRYARLMGTSVAPSALLLACIVLAPLAGAQTGCVVTSAPPGSYTFVSHQGHGYYVEFRNGQLLNIWTYEEDNGYIGLQRGGPSGYLGDWFPPGCDLNGFDLDTGDGVLPCLLVSIDPLEDETCGWGPDRLIY